MTDPLRLTDTVLHLDGVGPVTLAHSDPEYWGDKNRPEFRTGHILSVFSYATTWNYQERHPDGDELAVVLDGEVDFLVDTGSGEIPVRLPRGSACIVPTGAWHRVAVHEPSAILFITPVPARTEHRAVDREAREERLHRSAK